MKIRAFFALKLPQTVVRWLADHADTLCEFDRQTEVSWVDSEQYHLTLSFLGNINLAQVDQLEQLARERLEDVTSFQVHINSARYYRLNRSWALVAALTDQSEPLMALHHAMEQVAHDAGIQLPEEDAAFKPHITLGRMEARNHFEQPEQWPALDLFSLADSVVLLQSRPGERGSIYTPLFEIPLLDLA
ncbi:RNA 2',3'-cyclic phosphodiesterase [Marinobacterium arenosum]|uniref:RNA 2',3'-cyclic phosphodiesterase n=1 Tax=Marinobacterium arenosum TaxID=2862496 RepID=UPI001C98B267|nr:RNA 2',3'-cyclic phosphodiesterase [Marinobacterium arenosum]MBY4678620.1 RNA 2',3'-cyclic phosphodiesterase [Marinobacterium arenosum]